MTAIAPPARRLHVTIHGLISLAFALAGVVLAFALLYVALGTGKTPTLAHPSFWMSLAGLTFIALLVGAVILAAANSNIWVRVATIVALLLVDGIVVGCAVAFHWFHNWAWGQFGAGLLALLIIVVAAGLFEIRRHIN